MKHRYNIMGIKSDGYTVGLSVVANNMIEAIEICRKIRVNPHSICQAEQVHADALTGIVGRYEDIQVKIPVRGR